MWYNTVKEGKREKMEYENAARFLKSYNRIENQLKILYGGKATQNFTDLVKRCTDLNITVRRYENELIDYGKLRNAIVHRATEAEEVFIANPCDNVVENIEFIEKQLCHPPRLMDAIKIKKIASVFADKPLISAVETFAQTWQKSLVVYDHGTMVGIINSYGLYAEIAAKANEGGDLNDFLMKTPCSAILDEEMFSRYKLMGKDATVFEVFKAFEDQKNLLAVIITENGARGEKAMNIITPADFPRINRYLETYNVKTF